MSCSAYEEVVQQAYMKGSSGIPARRTRRPRGYWEDFSNLEREILEYIQNHGTPGVIPKLSELEAAGLGNLLRPIRDYGGVVAVADRLKLAGAWKRHREPYRSPLEWEEKFVADLAEKLGCDQVHIWASIAWWKNRAGICGPVPKANRKAHFEIERRAVWLMRKGRWELEQALFP